MKVLRKHTSQTFLPYAFKYILNIYVRSPSSELHHDKVRFKSNLLPFPNVPNATFAVFLLSPPGAAPESQTAAADLFSFFFSSSTSLTIWSVDAASSSFRGPGCAGG